jgi:hypothetical protein
VARDAGGGFDLDPENSTMTRNLKLAIICGISITSGAATYGQDVAGGPAAVGMPLPNDLGFSLALPVQFGLPGVNGATDRFGMPLVGPYLKPPSVVHQPAREVIGTTPDVARRANSVARENPTVRRRAAKAKLDRSLSRTSGAVAPPVPRYYVPHGSLDWVRGPEMINTAPADPYGYGYGFSGYGTEVFGDFWKGWPIVRY